MEYECELVLADRMCVDFNKTIRPLCTSCVNIGCSNPIVDKKISVFGTVMTTQLYETGTASFFVMGCDGYQPADGEDTEYEEEDEV
jgi:hypothetical protein